MTIEPKVLVSAAFGAVFLGTTVFLGLQSSVLEQRIDELEGQAQGLERSAASHLASLEDLQEQHADEISAREAVIAELQSEAYGLNREVDSLRDQVQQLEARAADRAARAEADREAHQTRVEELLGREQKSSLLSAQLAASIDEAQERLLAATQETAAASKSEMEARHLLAQAQQAATETAEAARLAQERLQAAEARSADLLGQVTKLETQLATVIEATGVAPEDLHLPLIEGAVLAFHEEPAPGLVVIDRGTKHGVKQGFTFEVFRDGQYKGRVRVMNVDETQCTAIVDKPYAGRTIEKGDKVATRI